MISKQHIIHNKPYSILLSLSIILFAFKAFQYAMIGSYIPSLFITFILFLFYLANRSSLKKLSKMLKFWGILLILWSVTRFVIEMTFLFDQNITESHIREQFTLFQNVLTILILFIGIYLLRKRSHFVNNSI